jgi:hypothetical protein
MRHEKFGGFMKKLSVLICSLALVIGTSASLSALDLTSYPSAFKQGNIAINAGIGLGSFGSVYGNTVVPPISATVDYALPIGKLPFSFGALVGFTSSKYSYSAGSYGTYSYDYSIIAIGARGAYHFNWDVKNLDTYFGLMLGYYIVSASYTGTGYYSSLSSSSAAASGIGWGTYVGARYFFTPNIGAFAELGYGFTYITGGVSIKI